MKNKLLITLLFLYGSLSISSQNLNYEFYKNIKEYFKLRGIKVEAIGKKDLEESIVVYDLVKGLNSTQVSIYMFHLKGHDTPFDIAIVENDSVELYQILAINDILRRIVNISNKYSNRINNRNDIKWIDKILDLHLSAINESVYNCCVMEVKRGKYTYNIMLNSLKNTE